MRKTSKIGVVIPALNEAQAIAKVLGDIPDWVDHIMVADNGSTDQTAEIAHTLGAGVVRARPRGYGAACLAGIAALPPCDVVVFLDGDYSDSPEQMGRLVDPIVHRQADLVIGSRKLGRATKGAMPAQQRFGNWLACFLIRHIWKVSYTDLGPFRAIDRRALNRLEMRDKAYGWTVEMQLRAISRGLQVQEVPVDYKARIGRSKVSGTVKGAILAGRAILGAIAYAAIFEPNESKTEIAARCNSSRE